MKLQMKICMEYENVVGCEKTRNNTSNQLLLLNEVVTNLHNQPIFFNCCLSILLISYTVHFTLTTFYIP